MSVCTWIANIWTSMTEKAYGNDRPSLIYTWLCKDSRNICLVKCMFSKVSGTSTFVCKVWLVVYGRSTTLWKASCNQWHTLMHLKCPQTPTFRQLNHVHWGNDTWCRCYGYYKLKFCQQPFSVVLENSSPIKKC